LHFYARVPNLFCNFAANLDTQSTFASVFKDKKIYNITFFSTMSTKNIQAAGFCKKAYAQPEMKVGGQHQQMAIRTLLKTLEITP